MGIALLVILFLVLVFVVAVVMWRTVHKNKKDGRAWWKTPMR